MQRHLLTALVAAATGAFALTPAGASAATSEQISNSIESATSWIRAQQNNTTGGLEDFGGDWAMSALAEAGISPAEVHGSSPGDPSLDDYFLSQWTSTPYTEPTNPNFNQNPSQRGAGDFAKIILSTYAGGLEPSALSADQNAVAQLAALYNKYAGTYGHEESVSETTFGLLAMAAVQAPRGLLAKSAEYLRNHQHDDGGWSFSTGSATTASEAEMTGAALAALCAGGATTADPTVARGIGFLESKFDPNTGAFTTPFGPSADTDAWALDGLLTCEVETEEAPWTTPLGKSPQDFLLSLQRTTGPDAGSFEYEPGEGETTPSLYSTQDALRALAGGSFIAYPPRHVVVPTVPAGTTVPLTLLVDTGYGTPSLCRVSAPTGSTVVEVLEAAETGGEGKYPPCVSGLQTNSEGVVTVLNGLPNDATHYWVVTSSQTYEAPPGEQEVTLGDFVRLRFTRSGGLEAGASSLEFGEQAEGTIGGGRSLYVRVREAPVEPRLSITGPQREDFLLSSGDCEGQQIEPGAGCTAIVRFAPAAAGEASATLHLLAGGSPYGPPIRLSGTGVAASADRGPEGLVGPEGPAGTQGPIGPVGPTDATGATGAKGEAGPRGPRGKSGRSATKDKKGRRKVPACRSRHRRGSGNARRCARRAPAHTRARHV